MVNRISASRHYLGGEGGCHLNRFQDESGQPVPFKIRALTQEN